MSNSFEISDVINAKPEFLKKAWLDSAAHGNFTGSTAEIDPKVGGDFSTWDGYIFGKTLEISDDKIIQSWRTTEFPKNSKDSRLEVIFKEHKDGTVLTFRHSDLPNKQVENYRQGWSEFYFKPMKEYYKGCSND